jgi:hypothetical protein
MIPLAVACFRSREKRGPRDIIRNGEFGSGMTRFLSRFLPRLLPCSLAVFAAFPAFSQTSQPAATATASVTSTASPEVAEFQTLEDKWSNAVNTRDQYGLELVLSPLFVDVSSSGDVSTRNQQVANLISLEDKSLQLDQHVVAVRMLGDIAVANGTYVLHRKAGFEEKGVFTHVFQRARGGWLCINSQRTMVKTDSKSKNKKQSAADEPFHIPLFSK